jgi:hypothetical protein
MGAIFTPSRRIVQPSSELRIDWSNPITQGLVGLLWCGPGGARELFNGFVPVVTNAVQATASAGTCYQVATAGANGVYSARIGAPNWVTPSAAVSYFCFANPTFVAGSSANFAGYQGNSNKGYNLVDYYATRVARVYAGATYADSGTGNWSTGAQVRGLTYDGAYVRCYDQGIAYGTPTALTGNIGYDTTYGRVKLLGSADYSGRAGDGYWAAVWTRALSPCEIAQLAQNPWYLFAPLRSRSIFTAPSAGGAVDADAPGGTGTSTASGSGGEATGIIVADAPGGTGTSTVSGTGGTATGGYLADAPGGTGTCTVSGSGGEATGYASGDAEAPGGTGTSTISGSGGTATGGYLADAPGGTGTSTVSGSGGTATGVSADVAAPGGTGTCTCSGSGGSASVPGTKHGGDDAYHPGWDKAKWQREQEKEQAVLDTIAKEYARLTGGQVEPIENESLPVAIENSGTIEKQNNKLDSGFISLIESANVQISTINARLLEEADDEEALILLLM